MRKFISFLLAFLLLLTYVPIINAATEYEVKLQEDGKIFHIGDKGKIKEILTVIKKDTTAGTQEEITDYDVQTSAEESFKIEKDAQTDEYNYEALKAGSFKINVLINSEIVGATNVQVNRKADKTFVAKVEPTTIKVGEKATVSATLDGQPVDELTISASPNTHVTIDTSNKTITGTEAGTEEITVTHKPDDYTDAYEQVITLTVEAKDKVFVATAAKTEIEVDETTEITAKLDNEDVDITKLTLEPKTTEILEVTGNKVKGLKAGNGTVTVKYTDDNNKAYTAEVTITVKDKPAPTPTYEVTATPNPLELTEGDTGNIKEKLTVKEKDTSDPSATETEVTDYTVTSADAAVLKLDADNFEALKEGSTDLTIQTANGNATIKVNVAAKQTPAPKEFTATAAKTEIEVDETTEITAKLDNEDVDSTKLSLSTVNTDIISIDGNKVKGLKAGNGTVTVKYVDENNNNKAYTAEVTIIVKDKPVPAKDFKATLTKEKIYIGKTAEVKATLDGEKIDASKLSLSTVNTDIISIDGNKVKGLKKGDAKIKVTYTDADNNNYETELGITVQKKNQTPVTPTSPLKDTPAYAGPFRNLLNDSRDLYNNLGRLSFIPQEKINDLVEAHNSLVDLINKCDYYGGRYFDRDYWMEKFVERYGYRPSETELRDFIESRYDYRYDDRFDRDYYANEFYKNYKYWPNDVELERFIREYYDRYYDRYYDGYYGYYDRYYDHYNCDFTKMKNRANDLVSSMREIARYSDKFSDIYNKYMNYPYIDDDFYYDYFPGYSNYFGSNCYYDGYYGWVCDDYDEHRLTKELKNLINEADDLLKEKSGNIFKVPAKNLKDARERGLLALKQRYPITEAIKELKAAIKELKEYTPSKAETYFPYMVGDTFGKFLPNKEISRAEMAVILNRILGIQQNFDANWKEQAAYNLKMRGIMLGDKKGNMMLEKKITMKELVTMLVRINNYATAPGNIYGLPVNWSTPYVQRAYVEGWLDDMSEVGPNTYVNRGQSARLINRAFKRQLAGVGESPEFSDVDRMHKYYEDIRIATSLSTTK